jgi:hypothetical protein
MVIAILMKDWLKQGLIDQETYNRAIEQNKQSMGSIGDEADDVFSLIEDRSKQVMS